MMIANVKRGYFYLVSAIALQAIVWAAIALVRNLIVASTLGSETRLSNIAVQLSILLVGVPIYLVHWLWTQRGAGRDVEERAAFLRRLYLDGMLLAFLAPAVNSARLMLDGLLGRLFVIVPAVSRPYDPAAAVLPGLIALAVLVPMWLYHYRVRRSDDVAIGKPDGSVVLDQIYTYLFCAGGLSLTIYGSGGLLMTLIEAIGATAVAQQPFSGSQTVGYLASILVGLPLWLIFWRQAQRLFMGEDAREQASVVRKIYLYLVVFVASLAAITTAAVILADLLQSLFGVPSEAGSLAQVLAIIVVSAVVWVYHARVLNGDAAVAAVSGQAATVRRIYQYLMSGVGLAAVLIGTGGMLSVLIRALDQAALAPDLRTQLAGFTASLAAGLPVWLLNWRSIETLASAPTPAGQEERDAFVRRLYLYLFMFVATMTLLGGTIFVVSQLVEIVLGARTVRGLLADVGQALAYALLAAAVLLYHRAILQREQQQTQAALARMQRALRVTVVDAGDGHLGRAVIDHLRDHVPGATVNGLGLNETAVQAMNGAASEASPIELLTSAEVIVGPWDMALPGAYAGGVSQEVAEAYRVSTARKLLLPVPDVHTDWIGVKAWKDEAVVREVGDAVEALAAGREIDAGRRLSPLAIGAIVLISLCALATLLPLIVNLISMLIYGS